MPSRTSLPAVLAVAFALVLTAGCGSSRVPSPAVASALRELRNPPAPIRCWPLPGVRPAGSPELVRLTMVRDELGVARAEMLLRYHDATPRRVRHSIVRQLPDWTVMHSPGGWTRLLRPRHPSIRLRVVPSAARTGTGLVSLSVPVLPLPDDRHCSPLPARPGGRA